MAELSQEAAQPKLYDQILFSEDQVNTRINTMAGEIIKRYQNLNPLFVTLLRGGAPFSSKLMFSIARQDPFFHPELDYMTIRTYGDSFSAKPPELAMGVSPTTIIDGRTVLLLDDVWDTGVTAKFAAEHLTAEGANKVDLCVLARKDVDQAPFSGEVMIGFETPDTWLTGMGLDDPGIGKEANRWAGFIATANQVA